MHSIMGFEVIFPIMNHHYSYITQYFQLPRCEAIMLMKMHEHYYFAHSLGIWFQHLTVSDVHIVHCN